MFDPRASPQAPRREPQVAARIVRDRITWALNGGTDIAQCNLHWLSPSGADPALLAADTNAATTALWSAIRGYFYTGVIWTGHDFSEIDPTNGHVLSTISGELPLTPAGSSGTNSLPPQISEVLTLRTALAGPSYRGRIYLPPMNTSVMTTSSQLSQTIAQTVASAWADYLQDAPAATDYGPIVWSKKGLFGSSVTQVEVGNTFDTQRRRRSSFVESRSSATV